MERSEQLPPAENQKCVGVKEGTLGNMGSEGVQEIMRGHFGKYGIRRGTGNKSLSALKRPREGAYNNQKHLKLWESC